MVDLLVNYGLSSLSNHVILILLCISHVTTLLVLPSPGASKSWD